MDAFLATQPKGIRLSIEALARAFEQAPRLRYLRGFSSLSADRREDFMQALLNGSYAQQMLLRAVLSPLKVAQYDDPDYFEAMGAQYRTPPVLQSEQPRHMALAIDAGELDPDEEIEAEVVVVGTGAGGAPLAAELAEMGVAVVLIEEGDYFQRQHFSGRAMDMLLSMYRDMGSTGTVGNTYIPVPLGRCVGGTTTINSGTCYRTPERVFHKWRTQYGLQDLSAETMEPYFAKVENLIQVNPADPKYVGAIGDIIARGCEALGWSKHGPLDRNAPDCDGASLCVFGCPSDAKRSTNVSYVPLALRYGANLIYNARVERILVRGGRAQGIEARTKNGTLKVKAGAVVLAAGSLMTPALLLKNKLANSSGMVGRNLSIHPALGVVALMDEQVKGYCAIPQGYGVEQFHEEGILYEGAFLPLDFGSGGLTMVGKRFTEVMEAMDRVAYFGFLIEDTTRGRVVLAPGGKPVMTYFMNQQDVARLKRGAEILIKIFMAAGARGVFPMVSGFEEIHDLQDLQRFRRARLKPSSFELTAHHPLGTCRMGADPRRSVVGPTNECHDVPGLFIADGSSVPSSLGVNPQVTIMALATRAAKYVARSVEV